jgi:hypothetical protein
VERAGLKVYRSAKRGRVAETEPALVEEGDFLVPPHLRNFLECIRTRKQPNCPVETAAAAVAGPHLANLALRRGKLVRFDGKTVV